MYVHSHAAPLLHGRSETADSCWHQTNTAPTCKYCLSSLSSFRAFTLSTYRLCSIAPTVVSLAKEIETLNSTFETKMKDLLMAITNSKKNWCKKIRQNLRHSSNSSKASKRACQSSVIVSMTSNQRMPRLSPKIKNWGTE